MIEMNVIPDCPIIIENKKSYALRQRISYVILFVYSILLGGLILLMINLILYPAYVHPIHLIVLIFTIIIIAFTYLLSGKRLIPIIKIMIYVDRFTPPYISFAHWLFKTPIYYCFEDVKTMQIRRNPYGNVLIVELKNNKLLRFNETVEDIIKQQLVKIFHIKIDGILYPQTYITPFEKNSKGDNMGNDVNG